MNIDMLISELIVDEGLRLQPYTDTMGKLTIGVGRNLTDIGVSEDEARYLLKSDLARVARGLDVACPWWRALSEARQRVVANMAFNLGLSGLLQFKNMMGALHNGDFADAADEMKRSSWARQVGKRAERLETMMRSG